MQASSEFETMRQVVVFVETNLTLLYTHYTMGESQWANWVDVPLLRSISNFTLQTRFENGQYLFTV